MKQIVTSLFIIALFTACGQTQKIYSTKAGAIKGYDPVAYFTEGEPIKGVKEQSVNWMGATWYFATEGNRKLFEENPEKYAPQYGGYCAYGVAKGGLFKIEPEAWRVVEGKLYLNYNLKFQKDWEADISGFIEQANENWPELSKKE